MINLSKKFKWIVLGDAQRSEIRNMSLRYPFREVAGFIVGEVKQNVIFSKQVIFGEDSEWKRHCFVLQGDYLREILNRNTNNPNCIPCLFHAHPNGNLFPTVWDVQSMVVTKIPWLIFSSRDDEIKFKGYIFESGVIRKIIVTNC